MFIPFEDHALIRREEPGNITGFGIVLPEIAIGIPYQGEVLAVGCGKYYELLRRHIPMDIKVGDTVVFSMYSGKKINIHGEELLLVNSKDILAVRLDYGTV